MNKNTTLIKACFKNFMAIQQVGIVTYPGKETYLVTIFKSDTVMEAETFQSSVKQEVARPSSIYSIFSM